MGVIARLLTAFLCFAVTVPFAGALSWAQGTQNTASQHAPPVALSTLLPSQLLLVPLFVNGRFQRELQALLPTLDKPLTFEGDAFVAVAERGLRDDLLAELRSRIDAGGFLNLTDLTAIGINARFDDSQLRLILDVPPSLLRPQLIELQRHAPLKGADPVLGPDGFSAFVNARSSLDIVHETHATGTAPGPQPLLLNFDGAFNPGPFVVEWVGSYDQGRDRPWHRGDISAVFDEPSNAWRTRLGDLSYPTTGFQSFVAAGGLTFAKNFDLQPYRVTQPTVRGSFFLVQESKVEVLVNNVVVRTFRLQPGPYDIRDFPLSSGINDAKLRITDPTGQVQVLDYPSVVDSSMLAQGEHEFSYSLGLPSTTVDGWRRYDGATAALSVFHRFGFTDQLTLGANFQGNRLQQMAGVEGVWATALGVFDMDLAWSRVDSHGNAMAARVGFRREDRTMSRDWQRVWGLSAEFKGRDFAPLGTLSPDNGTALDLSARVSQQFPYNVSVGLGTSYQIGRRGQRDADSQNVFVSKAWTTGINANLNLDRRRMTTGEVDLTMFLSLDVPLYDGGQKLTTTHDTNSRSTRAQWERRAPTAVGGVDAEVVVERDSDSREVSGELDYRGTRGRATLSHDIARPRNSGDIGIHDRRTTLRLESALVFAKGRFAVGRTVTDSFALLAPHPTLDGQTIGVNPIEDTDYLARIDALGNAVLPELGSYRVSNVTIDAPDVPQGLELGPQRMQVQPTYKSGILIEVGTGATVFVLGRIIDPDGTVVALQAAEIVSLNQKGGEPILTFTNRSGRFAAEGLRPGRYLFRPYATPDRSIVFEIPEGTVGRYDMGKLERPPAPADDAW